MVTPGHATVGLAKRFPELPPLRWSARRLEELGAAGGPLDGGYAHVSNLGLPAGYTYFAQLVMHDATAGDPPRLRLRSLYGDGPAGSPHLYDPADPEMLREGAPLGEGRLPDLPRDAAGNALLADARNARTVMSQQWHMAFVALHNRLHRRARADGARGAFERAQAQVRRVFQWLVLHDLLPRLVEGEAADAVARVRRAPPEDRLTAEFALAAAQLGHGLVKPRYRLNADFEAPVFRDPRSDLRGDDLAGQRLTPRTSMDWRHFLPLGSAVDVQHAARFQGRIARPLFHLRVPPGAPEKLGSLPYRTLDLGRRAGLPSGEDVATRLGVEPGEASLGGSASAGGTPLWAYLLREAAIEGEGKRLGPVGAALTTEGLVAPMLRDPGSCLHAPGWSPPRDGIPVTDLTQLLAFVLDARGDPRG